jgi:hypothetical protein
MAKLSLTDITSGFNLAAINDNFDRIEAEFQDKVLYRDNPVGEPNSMDNAIDMNGQEIVNLGAPSNANSALRLADLPTTPIGSTTATLTTFSPTATIASTNVQGAINESDTENRAALAAEIALLASATGSANIGFKQDGTNTVTRTVEAKLQEFDSVDDYTTLQLAASSGKSIDLVDKTYTTASNIRLPLPARFSGNGRESLIVASAAFPADYLLTLSPNVGQDPKNWIVEDFGLRNDGAAVAGILLDIATAGKYISKLSLRRIISHTAYSNNIFLELLNPVNVDGLFTMEISDCWSFGGYFLDNVGDSVILQRNTTTGAGRAYYVNQLASASHIMIRDGNSTSTGGVLIANSFNLTYQNMQNEVGTYTGTGTGLFTCQNGTATDNINLRILDNNFNTNGATNTTLACIFLNNTQNASITGNTLITNGTTGAHIVLDTAAKNTYIGPNTYFNQSGVEINPIISDSGVGTMGIWKAASETTWTVGSLEFFKDRDGFVHLRGNLSGAASTVGQVITTLPVGFRPSTSQVLVVSYATVVGNILIDTAGVVTLNVAGQTGANFDGLVFSAKV